MKTLLLSPSTLTGGWDLVKNASGNIALAPEPGAIAQDVASAARLFKGELWYDTTRGVPYFDTILGRRPPLEFLKAKFSEAARVVPGVAGVRVTLNALPNDTRSLTGKIEVIDAAGAAVPPIAIDQFWYKTAASPDAMTGSPGIFTLDESLLDGPDVLA